MGISTVYFLSFKPRRYKGMNGKGIEWPDLGQTSDGSQVVGSRHRNFNSSIMCL